METLLVNHTLQTRTQLQATNLLYKSALHLRIKTIIIYTTLSCGLLLSFPCRHKNYHNFYYSPWGCHLLIPMVTVTWNPMLSFLIPIIIISVIWLVIPIMISAITVVAKPRCWIPVLKRITQSLLLWSRSIMRSRRSIMSIPWSFRRLRSWIMTPISWCCRRLPALLSRFFKGKVFGILCNPTASLSWFVWCCNLPFFILGYFPLPNLTEIMRRRFETRIVLFFWMFMSWCW